MALESTGSGRMGDDFSNMPSFRPPAGGNSPVLFFHIHLRAAEEGVAWSIFLRVYPDNGAIPDVAFLQINSTGCCIFAKPSPSRGATRCGSQSLVTASQAGQVVSAQLRFAMELGTEPAPAPEPPASGAWQEMCSPGWPAGERTWWRRHIQRPQLGRAKMSVLGVCVVPAGAGRNDSCCACWSFLVSQLSQPRFFWGWQPFLYRERIIFITKI